MVESVTTMELLDCVNPNRFFEAAINGFSFNNVDRAFGTTRTNEISIAEDNSDSPLALLRQRKRQKSVSFSLPRNRAQAQDHKVNFEDSLNDIMDNSPDKIPENHDLASTDTRKRKLLQKTDCAARSESKKTPTKEKSKRRKSDDGTRIKSIKNVSKKKVKKVRAFDDAASVDNDAGEECSDEDDNEYGSESESSTEKERREGRGDNFDLDIPLQKGYFQSVVDDLDLSNIKDQLTSSRFMKGFKECLNYLLSRNEPMLIPAFRCEDRQNHVPNTLKRESQNRVPDKESKNIIILKFSLNIVLRTHRSIGFFVYQRADFDYACLFELRVNRESPTITNEEEDVQIFDVLIFHNNVQVCLIRKTIFH